VTEEVRNLALRAAEAVKNTPFFIDGTVDKVKEGTRLLEVTNKNFLEGACGHHPFAGMNLGRDTVSVTSSQTTSTAMSQVTSRGSQPTMFVSKWGPSSSSTKATT